MINIAGLFESINTDINFADAADRRRGNPRDGIKIRERLRANTRDATLRSGALAWGECYRPRNLARLNYAIIKHNGRCASGVERAAVAVHCCDRGCGGASTVAISAATGMVVGVRRFVGAKKKGREKKTVRERAREREKKKD